MADTAFEEVNQEFRIRRETLTRDSDWKQNQSANKEYEISDFYDAAGGPQLSILPSLLAIVLGAVFSVSILTLSKVSPANSLPSLPAIMAAVAMALSIALAALTYMSQQNARRALDRWKYVAPGWDFCRITFGASGIGVDGGHFLYFLEWAEILYVRETSERLELQHQKGQILVLPKRFFAPNEGADLSWDDVKSYIRNGAPQAQWS